MPSLVDSHPNSCKACRSSRLSSPLLGTRAETRSNLLRFEHALQVASVHTQGIRRRTHNRLIRPLASARNAIVPFLGEDQLMTRMRPRSALVSPDGILSDHPAESRILRLLHREAPVVSWWPAHPLLAPWHIQSTPLRSDSRLYLRDRQVMTLLGLSFNAPLHRYFNEVLANRRMCEVCTHPKQLLLLGHRSDRLSIAVNHTDRRYCNSSVRAMSIRLGAKEQADASFSFRTLCYSGKMVEFSAIKRSSTFTPGTFLV